MKRYLLFDSGCIKCSNLARTIEKEVDGWLVADSLHDPQIQELLDRAKPGWLWEPTLLEVNGDQVTVFTKTALTIHLMRGLGVKKTWQIAQLIHELISPPTPTHIQRRYFLRQSGALLGSLALLSLPKPHSFLSSLFSPGGKIENWAKYIDQDYGFTLEYPVDWGIETTIKQSTPFLEEQAEQAIIKRIIFSASYAFVYTDIWLLRDLDFATWLKWYADSRLVEGMPTANNATVSGYPALTFLIRGNPDLLATFVSDGTYVYRFMNRLTNAPESLEGYWHLLDTFIPNGSSLKASEIPLDVKQEADSTSKLSGILASSCCSFTFGGNPFPCCGDGNCTWWVYYKMGSVPFTGNAAAWWGQVPDYWPTWKRQTGSPPTNQDSIAWKSGPTSEGHVAYIANYTGGNNISISDMCCGSDPPPDCWVCVRSTSKPKTDYGGFIFRFNEP